MSIIQYRGALSVTLSSNSGQVATGRGGFVSLIAMNQSACLVTVYDSNVSAISGKIVAVYGTISPANQTFGSVEPAVPTYYGNGLYVNNSNATNVVVTYIEQGPQTS